MYSLKLNKKIINDIVFIALLLVLIPFLILYFLGLPNGLILTLIYMQLIIIWVQAEISMRQLALYRSESIPIIALGHSSSTSMLISKDAKATGTVTFIVRNLSDNPAFNIMLSRILSWDHRSLYPSDWNNIIRCGIINYLAPKEEKELCSTTQYKLKELMKTARIFEIDYVDKYGEWHSTAFIIDFIEGTGSIEIRPVIHEEGLEKVGILLPALSRIRQYWIYRKSRKRFKKLLSGFHKVLLK